MAKLLVLDDEPGTLEWMGAALTSQGHDVRCYTSGYQALNDVDEWRPDLIISDILMPEIDGLAFAKLLRKRGDTPLMFISIAMKQAEAILAGAVGYVQKPATANEVRAAVEEVLGRPQGRSTILVVDDDDYICELYKTYLEPAFDVQIASYGTEALAILRAHPVALVITDFHMPEMNGAELIRAIRADPSIEHLPVIVQTSDRMVLESSQWRELKVAYRIEKFEFLRWLMRNIETKLAGPDMHAMH